MYIQVFIIQNILHGIWFDKIYGLIAFTFSGNYNLPFVYVDDGVKSLIILSCLSFKVKLEKYQGKIKVCN